MKVSNSGKGLKPWLIFLLTIASSYGFVTIHSVDFKTARYHIGQTKYSQQIKTNQKKQKFESTPLFSSILSVTPTRNNTSSSNERDNFEPTLVFSSEENKKRFNRALIALGSTLSLSYNEATDFLLSQPQLYEDNSSQAPLHAKLLYLQTDIGISKKRLKKMILTHPSLIATAIDEMDGLRTSVELLQCELDLTGEEVWNLATHSFPQVRSYPRGDLRKTLNFYQNDLQFSREDLKKMVLRQPKVLQHSPEILQEAIDCLQMKFSFSPVSLDELKRMIMKFPSFLTYDTHKNFIPTIEYLLTSEIGRGLGGILKNGVSTDTAKTMDEKQSIIQERVKSFLIKSPNMIGFSIKDNLKPTVKFFLDDDKNDGIGCSLEQFGKILWRHSDVLGYSLLNNLKPKIKYLKKTLHLQDSDQIDAEENLANLITRNPNFLSYSLESNLAPKFQYFEKNLEFEPNELRAFFVTRPQTLSLSLVKNIAPKVEYFLSTHGGDMTTKELKHFLLNKPGQLNFSLDDRIKKRVEALKKHGIHLRDTPVTIISRTDGSFEKW